MRTRHVARGAVVLALAAFALCAPAAQPAPPPLVDPLRGSAAILDEPRPPALQPGQIG